MIFQQDNARPHTADAIQRALRGVQLPWPARAPDLSPVQHVWDTMKRELILSPESATTSAELRQRVQDAWDMLSQDDIPHFCDSLHARIHAYIAAREWRILCIYVTVWVPLTVTSVFHLV